MTRFSFAGDKCIKTEVVEYVWTDSHREMLYRMQNSDAGAEFREQDEQTDTDIKLCRDLENMGLARLVHSTFYKCWRLTEEGQKAVNNTTWEISSKPRRF